MHRTPERFAQPVGRGASENICNVGAQLRDHAVGIGSPYRHCSEAPPWNCRVAPKSAHLADRHKERDAAGTTVDINPATPRRHGGRLTAEPGDPTSCPDAVNCA